MIRSKEFFVQVSIHDSWWRHPQWNRHRAGEAQLGAERLKGSVGQQSDGCDRAKSQLLLSLGSTLRRCEDVRRCRVHVRAL